MGDLQDPFIGLILMVGTSNQWDPEIPIERRKLLRNRSSKWTFHLGRISRLETNVVDFFCLYVLAAAAGAL